MKLKLAIILLNSQIQVEFLDYFCIISVENVTLPKIISREVLQEQFCKMKAV